MTDQLLEQDLKKLLALLRESPKTHTDLIAAMRLSSARIGSLLELLRQRNLIHAPRCFAGSRGRTVNLWEPRHPASSQDPGTSANQ